MAEVPHWSFDEADLSASFDDSMNVIGGDVSSMFNMRDALSALPLCDEEVKLHEGIKCGAKESSFFTHSRTYNSDVCPSNTINNTLFNNVLKAATSSLTRYSEASLTYLNQGQCYELKLNCNISKTSAIKSYIRVRFQDKHMELRGREHMNYWRQTHPGEHLLNIDYDKSHNYDDLDIDHNTPNAIICVWNSPECVIGIKFNCISTEFTAKKHGGEKGVPLRFQVDHFELETSQHLESFACQIKVFKMKGADRKHRTDRERIERKSIEGKSIYKPSSAVTVLSLIPKKSVDSTQQLGVSAKQVSISKLNSCSGRFIEDSNYSIGSSQPITIVSTDSIIQTDSSKKLVGKVQSHSCLVNHSSSNILPSSRASTEFATPSYPCQRSTFSLLRNSSPAPSPSPSSTRRVSCTVQPCFQRRRRPRVGDCCVGSCSSCGRSCRNSVSRWVRSSKSRIICPTWDNSIARSKQSNWISDRRRVVQSHDDNTSLADSQKSKTVHAEIPINSNGVINNENNNGTENDNNNHPAISTPLSVCELSTSADSSVGNDELSKWTLVDKYDDGNVSPPLINSDYPLVSLQTNGDPLLSMSSSISANRDAGYCSDIHVSSVLNIEDNMLKQLHCRTDQQSLNFEGLHVDESDPHSDVQEICEQNQEILNREVDSPNESHEIISTYTVSEINSEMSALQVADWLRQHNFANLIEIFRNFTGCDMLRLTKEDFLSLCGPLEGLRIYNALSHKPQRPKCTLYLCLRGESIYRAVMLYKLIIDELHNRIANIISCRTDQIKMICLLTTNNIPVLITDELILQLKDQSCYEITVSWSCGNKANVYLKLVQ